MADNSDVMDKIKELNNQDALNSKKQVAIQGNDGALKYISYDSKTKQYNVQTRSGGSANLRGNNPGNIIATAGSEKWEGVVGTRVDPEGRKFLVFDSMASGQSAAKNLLNSSQWLFYGAVCAFGSGIACLLSEGLRHKKNWFYVVKGIAIAVTILFIVVIFAYKNQCDIQAIVFGKKYTTAKANAILLTTTLVSVISGFLGLLFQTGGIALNLVYGVDD